MQIFIIGIVCGIGIGIAMTRFAFDSMLRREDKKLKDECDHLRGEVKRLRAQVALHINHDTYTFVKEAA